MRRTTPRTMTDSRRKTTPPKSKRTGSLIVFFTDDIEGPTVSLSGPALNSGLWSEVPGLASATQISVTSRSPSNAGIAFEPKT